MCKVLFRSGWEWARDTVADGIALAQTTGGIDSLIEMVKRGMVDKPDDYAAGVRVWVDRLMAVRDVAMVKARAA